MKTAEVTKTVLAEIPKLNGVLTPAEREQFNAEVKRRLAEE